MASKKKEAQENMKNEKALDEEDIKETSDSISEETAENVDNTEEKDSDKEDAAQAEIKSLNDRLLRLQADFLNYKARTEKEKTSTYNGAVSDLILDLLPVLDNLERAIAADSSDGSSFKEGVQMVYNQFMGILDKKGLKEVEALHKPFDHNVHYGVAYDEHDEYEDGTVIDVLQKGYTVNEKCIRPAMVRICRK